MEGPTDVQGVFNKLYFFNLEMGGKGKIDSDKGERKTGQEVMRGREIGMEEDSPIGKEARTLCYCVSPIFT